MAFITVVSILLAASGSGASTLVLWFAGLGGFTGLATAAGVYVNYRRNNQVGRVENKSVAITELEKAVPGLGDIIEQWQAVVHQLQTDLSANRLDLEHTRADLLACRAELETYKKRLEEIEGA